MKRFLCQALCVFLLSLSLVHAAAPAPAQPAAKAVDSSPGGALASTVTAVTGLAISPLLGTGLYGCYQYLKADTPEQKAALPWFAQVSFWLPALLVVGVCAAKDSLGAVVPPGLKKPLDVLETVENKASGLVAAGAVVPFTMSTLSKVLVADAGGSAHISSSLAMLGLGSIDLSWLLNLLTVPFGVFMFALVWMASHAINVLILLSPWGAVDAVLKGARTALLGLLTLTATINPWIGAALSVVVVILAYLVAGWSFRLMVFGSLFSWDFFTLRKARFHPQPTANRMFSGSLLKKLGVPVRTYGSLRKQDDGSWLFVYRPWLVGPVRQTSVEPGLSEIGRGLFFSTIREPEGTLFLLPPRYRGHEELIASQYAIAGGVRPAGILKAWGVLRDLFTGGSSKLQVA